MTGEEILAKGTQYSNAAKQLNDFLTEQGEELDVADYKQLSKLLKQLQDRSDILLDQAVVQLYIDSIDALIDLDNTTQEINSDIKKLKKVQKAITLVADAVELVAGLATGNIKAGAESVGKLISDFASSGGD